MKLSDRSRIKNSVRNILFGALGYGLSSMFSFIMRTVIIYRFGVEYVGINTLFASVLQVLNLSELGFSTTIAYALYKPIAKNDIERICSIISFYRKAYRFIGLFIFCVGVLLCPFIEKIINGTYPSEINIHVIFLLLLVNTSISYWFFGYKSVVFFAYQRNDMLSKTKLASSLLMYVLQTIALIIIEDYYAYIVCMIVGTLVNNFLLEYNSKRMFPEIKPCGKLSKNDIIKLFKKIGTLFGHQLDVVIITSTDNIIISAYLGLNVLATYGNYNVVINVAISVLIMIAHSFAASIGDSLATDSKEKNYKDFINFSYMFINLSGICAILMFIMFQDFMTLWMGEDMLLDNKLVFLLCFCFFVRMAKRPGNTYKVEQGLWDSDMLKPYIAGLVNLGFNIITVNYIGLYGVVISTIISLGVIEKQWETFVLFRYYFNSGVKKYILMQLHSVIKLLIIGCLTYKISTLLPVTNVLLFLLKLLLIVVIVVGIFILSSIKDKEYRYMISKLKTL